MKRYLAFYYQGYYPQGGMNDCIGAYDSLEESIQKIEDEAIRKPLYGKNSIWDDCSGHVYDTLDNKIVWSK